MRLLPRIRPTVLLPVLAALLLPACSAPERRSADEALEVVRRTLADSATAHVGIGSSDLPAEGDVLVSADGDFRRPDSFRGTFQLRVDDETTDVELLAVGGELYVQRPGSEELEQVTPASFPYGDPLVLVSPDGGLRRLLDEATDIRDGGTDFAAGQAVDVVRGQVPGELVADLLVAADPSQPFDVAFGVSRTSDELRTVSLTGPFYEPDGRSTHTLFLTEYDAPVDIPSPSAVASSLG